MGRLAQWVVIEADVAVRRMSHDQKVRLADEIYAQQPNMLASHSRGEVRLKSRDPSAPPLFRANYLSHPEDVATLVRGVRLARKIMRAPSLARLVSSEILPGPDTPDDDAALEAQGFVREERGLRTGS